MPRRPRVLSHRIEAIEYTHADDGLPYRHDFVRSDSEIELESDGSVRIRNARGKRLWGLYSGKPFLENPPPNGGTMKKRKPKRARRSSAAKSGGATKKRRTRSTRRHAATSTRRRRSTAAHSTTSGGHMARKRSSASSARGRRRNPPASRRRSTRRRSHRRNPPAFSTRGILNTVIDGALNGATVLGAEAAAGYVSRKVLGRTAGSSSDVAAQAAVGIAISMFGPRFLGADRARIATAGAFAAAGRAFVKNVATDATTKAVAPWYNSYLGMIGQPMGPRTIAAYPAAGALGASPGFADPYDQQLGIYNAGLTS